MKLIGTLLLAGSMVGCSSVPNCGTWEDNTNCRVRNERARFAEQFRIEEPERMRQAEARAKQEAVLLKEREAQERANPELRDIRIKRLQGYVVCEKYTTYTACK
jgi:hypothetical protein